MCVAALSPLGAAVSGKRSGLAMISPIAALIAGKKKDKPQGEQATHTTTYPDAARAMMTRMGSNTARGVTGVGG